MDSVNYLTITSLGRAEIEQEKERERSSPQSGRLVYLDDKMTASAGTKSLPFTLIISPTSTCEKKLIMLWDANKTA